MKKYILTCICLLFVSYGFSQDEITVAEEKFNIAPHDEVVYYYGFAEGDEMVFNFKELKGRELKEVEIIEYPSTSRFMDYKSREIIDKSFIINKQGIYKFRFANSEAKEKVCEFKIERIPATERSRNFNTTVYWKTISDTSYSVKTEKYLMKKEFVPKKINPTQDFYLHSIYRELIKNGKARISFPVRLPENTVEWYYEYSADRKKANTENTKKLFNLAGQLSKLIDKTGMINIGIDMLSIPPGGNECSVYLMDSLNYNKFETKGNFVSIKEGSRDNLVSGIIRMNGGAGKKYYIGISNPNHLWSINVVIEVVAIVQQEQWGERNIRIPDIKTHKEAYLK